MVGGWGRCKARREYRVDTGNLLGVGESVVTASVFGCDRSLSVLSLGSVTVLLGLRVSGWWFTSIPTTALAVLWGDGEGLVVSRFREDASFRATHSPSMKRRANTPIILLSISMYSGGSVWLSSKM